MGRKKLPEDLKRKRHTFRLSKEAKETLRVTATNSGQTMSQLLERLIMGNRKGIKLTKV